MRLSAEYGEESKHISNMFRSGADILKKNGAALPGNSFARLVQTIACFRVTTEPTTKRQGPRYDLLGKCC